MMTRLKNTLLLCCTVCLLIIFSSCSENNSPIPRRYAYPRLSLYSEDYQPLPGDQLLNIEKNKGCTVLTDSVAGKDNRWITLSYPKYHSQLYLTINRCSDRNHYEAAYSNRIQRISLNTGGKDFEQIELANEFGFTSEILSVRGVSATPVMFISTDGCKYILSGIFYIADQKSVTSPDSISPVIESVQKDIIHLVKNLKAL